MSPSVRRMVRLIDRVAPTSAWIASAIVLPAAVALELAFMGGLYLRYGALPDHWHGFVLYRGAIVLGLVALAIRRAVMINPAYRTSYREWLLTTPWTPARPLPLGPVYLTWQDGAVLVIAAALFAKWPESLIVPLAFLAPYCLILGHLNLRAGQDGSTFVAAAAAALLPWSATDEGGLWIGVALTAIVLAAVSWGWRGTLRAYPWRDLPRWEPMEISLTKGRPLPKPCHWWPRVHPWRLDTGPLVTRRETLLAATLAGWIVAVAIHTTAAFAEQALARGALVDPSVPALVGANLLLGIGVAGAVLRLIYYVFWTAPPLSLAGRWRRRQWIISGYDRVFVAPALTLGAAILLPRILDVLGVPMEVSGFVSAFAATAIALGMGPTLAEWALTGEYRTARHTPVEQSRGRSARSYTSAKR